VTIGPMTSATMTALETADFARIACQKCRVSELYPRSPSILNRITSFYPYKCNRCGHNQQRFRFNLVTVPFGIFLGVMLTGAV
jgi:predicted nucleic-acid-binding Zn-ribbon protein